MYFVPVHLDVSFLRHWPVCMLHVDLGHIQSRAQLKRYCPFCVTGFGLFMGDILAIFGRHDRKLESHEKG